jgi:meso-butanediol dehydrogenase/(S,S)-butanediol dehydrogenase/diacetyl reductase
MYDLDGKVALVTGTSSKKGIGASIALRLAREGADVVVSDRSKADETYYPWDKQEGWKGLDSLVEEIQKTGRRALAVTADVSKSSDVARMVDQAIAEFGKIDILVNNAALTASRPGFTPIVDLKEDFWNLTMAVNLTGVFLVSQAVVRQMIKQGQGGKVVNIASCTGKKALENSAAYCTSKAAVIGLTQSMALEWARYKINVNAICPGFISSWGTQGKPIYTNIQSGLSEEEATLKAYRDAGVLQLIPMGRPGTIQELVDSVTYLTSNQSDYITGQSINVCGGYLMVR